MNGLIGLRRLDHYPYLRPVIKQLLSEGAKLTFILDPNFESDKSWKVFLEEHPELNKNRKKINFLKFKRISPMRLQCKNFISVLAYLSDSEVEIDYLIRYATRAKFTGIFLSIIKLLSRLPRQLRTDCAKLAMNFCRNHLEKTNSFELPIYANEYDFVLLTPGNMLNSVEDELIGFAKKNGIKSFVLALSFDNLNSKGTISAVPDCYLAWNSHHAKLLVERHQIPRDQIAIVGAPYFEYYANPEKKITSKNNLCKRYGLDAKKPWLVYMGSSANVSADENRFLKAILQQHKSLIKDYEILIRPHPANVEIWKNWRYPGTKVLRTKGKISEDLFDVNLSVYQSAVAAVGVNTSGFLDALACGLPVFPILNEDSIFQENATHFVNLLEQLKITLSVTDFYQQLKLVLSSEDLLRFQTKARNEMLPHFGNVSAKVIAAINSRLNETKEIRS